MMKKGILFLVFFTFVLFLFGCETEHVHSLSSEWSSDEFYHWHKCSQGCNEMFEKSQHIWDDGVITKEATEEVEGEKTYTCTICFATKIEVVSTLDHIHEFSTEYSHDEVYHWYAATCGHEDATQFKELHKYEFVQQTAATCTEDEVLIGTCVCGDTTIVAGEDAKGHNVLNYASNLDATCTANGTKTGTCDTCHETITNIDEGSMLEHKWNHKLIEATYFSSGESYKECDDCGAHETLEIIPMLVENVIDGEIDDFFDGVNEYSGERTGPVVEHEAYIKLGIKGIYVYQLVTDGKGLTSTSHVELYFTLGKTAVLDDSLSVHIYAQGDYINSYTYSSSTNVKKDNNIADKYCDYAIKVISSGSNLATYACELFVDYSYFGLTEAPEFINVQIRTISGGGNPLSNKTAGSLDYKDLANYEMFGANGRLIKTETAIDAEKGDFYNGVEPYSGKRIGPVVTHDSYIKLAGNGIYVYQLVTDGSGKSTNSHVELYFTLGENTVANNSLSVHIYYESTPKIRTYTYSSTTNVSRNDNLAAQYCLYSVKLISNEGGIATYAYELFVDYSFFGLTTAPNSIKTQIRAVSGEKNPLTNNTTGTLDYKDITNYETYGANGYIPKVETEEIIVDGIMDDRYTSLTPLTAERSNPAISQEVYVYIGEKGIYVYQLVTDPKEIVASKTASQLYITVGDELTSTNAFGVYCYFDSSTENPFRTYRWGGSSYGRKSLGTYPDYCSLKVLETNGSTTKYAYEMFFEYSLFGITSAPETVKVFAVARSYNGAAVANGNVTSDAGMTDITKYATFSKNDSPSGEETKEIVLDGNMDKEYTNITPMIGKRSDPVVTQEAYLYFGEKGIYVYQLVTDGSGKTDSAHVEWYFTLGDAMVLADSLSIHLYYEKAPYIRSYTYNSTTTVSRNDNIASTYCDYFIKLISNENGKATYVYELFVDYSYFGLTEAPKSIKAQMRAQSGSGSPLTNSVHSGTLDYRDIANYYTFDKNGYVYTNVNAMDIELDETDIVSNNYEIEFTIQTLNSLNKLSGVKFAGNGSQYITELGNGRYKLSIPVDKMVEFLEEQQITINDYRNIGTTFTIKILEEVKTTYKLLMLGNSFSDDTIQWVYEICDDLGIEITIANLYVGGCTLERHLSNLLNDVNEYTYVEYDNINKTWIRNENISIAEALAYEKWNYVSLQQGSTLSGQANTYDSIDQIMDEILKLKSNVKFVWNMTWAYQQDSTHSGFANYENSQETMYEAIVNSVETKVLTNNRIELISPAGTAIQNARTSFVGDTLTRDGHHLSYELGRYIAGLTMVGTLTGADLTQVKYSPNLEDKYRDMAIEAAINAINNPYSVTQSTFVN